jgi:hypothetical protein
MLVSFIRVKEHRTSRLWGVSSKPPHNRGSGPISPASFPTGRDGSLKSLDIAFREPLAWMLGLARVIDCVVRASRAGMGCCSEAAPTHRLLRRDANRRGCTFSWIEAEQAGIDGVVGAQKTEWRRSSVLVPKLNSGTSLDEL